MNRTLALFTLGLTAALGLFVLLYLGAIFVLMVSPDMALRLPPVLAP